MSKSMLILGMAVLSLTLFSFISPEGEEANPYITLLPQGNYYLGDIDFTADDEAALDALQDESYAGFFVRCEEKGCNKFSHATIAGGGCCNSLVENPSPEDQAAANSVRAEVEAILSNYMP